MVNKQYPKEKYGSDTTIEVNTATQSTVAKKDEVYNGGVTRSLHITEDSIKIEDEKDVITRVFDAYKQKKEGKILGFLIDASAYHPQTFKVSRIIVKTIKFADK